MTKKMKLAIKMSSMTLELKFVKILFYQILISFLFKMPLDCSFSQKNEKSHNNRLYPFYFYISRMGLEGLYSSIMMILTLKFKKNKKNLFY